MHRILLATDLTEGSRFAVQRACAIAARSLAHLRIVHVLPARASEEDRATTRARLRAETKRCGESLLLPELELSIRTPCGDPTEGIKAQADSFRPDLIILGAQGEFRLRDVIFGTTTTGVVREAHSPVLVVQTDRPWKKVMAAIDDDTAEPVLRLAAAVTDPQELHIVHAFQSAPPLHVGLGNVLEDVRSDREAAVASILRSAAPALTGRARYSVKEGETMSVIMNAWSDIDPDLVVIGTHGRSGLAWLVEGSVAEAILLGCPTDMLVAPSAASSS